MRALRRRWKVVLPLGLASAALMAWLAFGFFGIQTLFIDKRVSEAAPAFATVSGSTVTQGQFIGRSHPAEGRALVLADGSNRRVLRFEDFRTDNGPDLNVYLSTGPAAGDAGSLDDDFVDLGDLRGNIGPQNYEIPEGVNLERHDTVVIWCVRFGVAFAAADLMPVAGT